MRNKNCNSFYKWTARIVLPNFIFFQVFVTGAALAAGSEDSLSVTGALVSSSANEPDSSSTNAPAGMTTIEPSQTNAIPDKFILNFEDTPLKTVLLYLADITGETILFDNTLKGYVNIINPKPVTPEEAKQIIFSILEMQNCTIVRHEDYVKIIKSGDAKQSPIETLQPPENIQDMDTEDIIRAQVIYPDHIPAADVKKFLDPMVTKGAGQIVINEPTGAVIIIDTGANIKRLMEIIGIIDRVIEGGEIDVRIVPLKYADETEMKQMLTEIFNSPVFQDPTAQTITYEGGKGAPAAKPAAKVSPTPAPTAAQGGKVSLDIAQTKGSKATFIPELRMHALIVISAKKNYPLILQLIKDLDVPSTEKDDDVLIFPLQHAKAEEMADILNDIFSERTRDRSRRTTAPSSSRFSRSRSSTSRSTPPTPSTSRSRSSSVKGSSVLAGKVDVIPYEPANSLIIITSPRYYENVKRIIQRLDQRTPQAWIEAMIVEVSRDKNFSLDVGWQRIIDTKDIFGGDSKGMSLVQALDMTVGPSLEAGRKELTRVDQQGISYTYGKDEGDHFSPYLTLQTFEDVEDINVLSTPSILASNNKEAEISVGRQIPISRYSRGDDGQDTRDYSWEYTDVNIVLNVTPRINRHREVSLETKVMVKDTKITDVSSEKPPIISDRSASTEVVLQDGQTLVIGGLIKDDFGASVSKIPLLGDIPIVKYLFRTTSDTKTKRELLIFVTPYVVESEEHGDYMTSTIVHRYRGTKNFLNERERSQIYDELNSERSDLTIYDDWKEFEEHVEFVNNYFRPALKVDKQVESSGYFFMEPSSFPEKETPYEGELSGVSDAEPESGSAPEDQYGNPTEIYYMPTQDESKPEDDSQQENSTDNIEPGSNVSNLLLREKLLVDKSGEE